MDYQKMYTTLFNAITDALSQIETQNYGDAKETLISAQHCLEIHPALQSRCLPDARFSIHQAFSQGH